MAVLHFAYRFDPVPLFSGLRECFSADGAVVHSALHHRAALALRDMPTAGQEALIALRYGDTWLCDDDDEADLEEKWWMLCLMHHFCAVPSLGREGMAHHVILKAVLPGLGVIEDEVKTLVSGYDLKTLIAQAPYDIAPDALPGLGDFGGWLSVAQIEKIKDRLASVEMPFTHPSSDQRDVLAKIYLPWAENAEHVCRDAFDAAMAMLDGALEHQNALFLVLD